MENTQPFKEKLLVEKARLEEELNHIGKKLNTETGDWVITAEKGSGQHPDLEDNADDIIDFQEKTALLGPLEAQYADVVAALAKIEEGNYGMCEKTGEQIPTEQLEANPAARVCLSCE